MVRLVIVVAIFIATGTIAVVHGAYEGWQPRADREAIIQVAHDYIDGFYDGSTERMERALHPDVAKRNIVTDRETGKQRVRSVTTQHLIAVTGSGTGKRIAEKEGRQCDVTVLDIHDDVATVKVVAITWIDYLHVARVNGEWKIINVLWAWKS